MVIKKRITVSWSGGKDSAFALFKIRQDPAVEIVNLHTLINTDSSRVGLHGVHENLIRLQAEAMGLPLAVLYLQTSESNDAYEKLLKGYYQKMSDEGITHVLYGDIFLEDLKEYRLRVLADSGLHPVFPLWKMDSLQLVREFVAAGFKTVLCATNPLCYEKGLLGKTIDRDFPDRLPDGTDPCGENGEFHTFVYDGPLFRKQIPVTLGETSERTYTTPVQDDSGKVTVHQSSFYFQDLFV